MTTPLARFDRFARIVLVSLATAAPTWSQFGAVGLSGVGGQRFANEDLLFFQPENGDHFGRSLATGDFNGDGADDLATGIPLDDGLLGFSPDDCGAVVVRYGSPFGGLEPGLAQNFLGQFLAGSPDVPDGGDNFGFSLVTGDFDRDGRDDLAIGTPGEFVLVPGDGMVTVVMGSFSGIDASRRHGLTAGRDGNPGVANQADREYGHALASGDFDADGHADLAIGAPFENENGLFDVGAEVVLDGSLFGSNFDNGDSGFWSETVP